jgi:hypothetical protein
VGQVRWLWRRTFLPLDHPLRVHWNHSPTVLRPGEPILLHKNIEFPRRDHDGSAENHSSFVIAVTLFPRWHGNGCNWDASPLVGVNLFPQFRAKSPERIALAPIEPPGFPLEEEGAKPANMVIPIQVSDVDYALLMHALCPAGTRVPEDVPADVPETNAPSVVDGADQPPPLNLRMVAPDRPPGTPIV